MGTRCNIKSVLCEWLQQQKIVLHSPQGDETLKPCETYTFTLPLPVDVHITEIRGIKAVEKLLLSAFTKNLKVEGLDLKVQ